MKLIDADLLKIAINHERYHGGFKVKDVTQIIDEQLAVDAIPIPDGATNGDMIKALFPNASVYEHNGGSTYSVNNEYKFNTTWWNAPYLKEKIDYE